MLVVPAAVARARLRAVATEGCVQAEQEEPVRATAGQVRADLHAFMEEWRVCVPDNHSGWVGAGRRYGASTGSTLVWLTGMEGDIAGEENGWIVRTK